VTTDRRTIGFEVGRAWPGYLRHVFRRDVYDGWTSAATAAAVCGGVRGWTTAGVDVAELEKRLAPTAAAALERAGGPDSVHVCPRCAKRAPRARVYRPSPADPTTPTADRTTP
jgi:hypothetical protein